MMDRLSQIASVPIMAQPNAGLPMVRDGQTVYDVTPEEFGADCSLIAKCGASVIGGCCGTTPDYIREMIAVCKDYKPVVEDKGLTVAASYSKAVYLGNVTGNCRREDKPDRKEKIPAGSA